ncbi:2-oxoglutarate dehydrogenase E1 component [Salirhabdus salicampi]|uniref:2-oxoglutarate dehydrogenase E1 component n=1 Tax=Salirhabdus salicampi TaxID=476102 RepID=UPI0020C210D1|nr:2-oxoglutarate dehydrogenase E1 component [Salirhabdus salicampi]MCP8615299.1 2-oxoglutarate dehydrogenase E1 component [Salirhabdus salicampi]
MGVVKVSNKGSHNSIWENFHGPNMGYIEEQYDLFIKDPDAVDPSLREMFEQFGAPDWMKQDGVQQSGGAVDVGFDVEKVSSAIRLVDAIRRHGHLEANVYPVGKRKSRYSPLVDPKTYGLTEADLKAIPAKWLVKSTPKNVQNGLDLVNKLKERYSGTISYEFYHVQDDSEREWLQQKVESGDFTVPLDHEEKKALLKRLAEVEGFENFLAKTFVAQKRFSIEGLDMMVPMLDQIVKEAANDEVEHIMMGMAHRGRLNVLAHVLGKPYDKIFSEFHHAPNKELVPSEGSKGINYGWTGDVKYHFGADREVEGKDAKRTRITLAHNPSHLEFVNPVVGGYTRAAQDDRSERGYAKHSKEKAVSIVIHGDAAFIGEGVVAETLNMSQLRGYNTGGTIHLIANNLVGFTTNNVDSRSTMYASDLAKGFEIPVIHVNADDPIACLLAVAFAYEYRKTFYKDVLIDLVGYRRYGHNEMDEPRMTQPSLYKDIDQHPTVLHVFADRLKEEGVISDEEFTKVKDEVHSKLKRIYDGMKENEKNGVDVDVPEEVANGLDKIETAVPLDLLKSLNDGLLKRPEGFNGFKKLERILQKRKDALEEGNKVDWATGEALAFATILNDGHPIRITGQDSERGTFAHRHLVLHDTETEDTYCPMHGLEEAKASFDIYNSPLSEAGVLGFEYGYSVQAPNTLVLWEAQFGDFANAAQVIFDQFISSGRAKWGQKSSMVFLLPHGYEGQGPEHSSARLERFLQLSAEHNWTVANVTSSAQYFHLLRRQAAIGGKEEARPLVLVTPKSLLRNQRIACDSSEFTKGKFKPILEQKGLGEHKDKVERLLVGSGKIMVDIEEELEKREENFDWMHILRLEQIYPFPKTQFVEILEKFPNVEEIVWVQEEPKNMGSWNFVKGKIIRTLKDNQTIQYVGRTYRSSPSVGDPNIHKIEQNRIINEALKLDKGGDSREGN